MLLFLSFHAHLDTEEFSPARLCTSDPAPAEIVRRLQIRPLHFTFGWRCANLMDGSHVYSSCRSRLVIIALDYASQ